MDTISGSREITDYYNRPKLKRNKGNRRKQSLTNLLLSAYYYGQASAIDELYEILDSNESPTLKVFHALQYINRVFLYEKPKMGKKQMEYFKDLADRFIDHKKIATVKDGLENSNKIKD